GALSRASPLSCIVACNRCMGNGSTSSATVGADLSLFAPDPNGNKSLQLDEQDVHLRVAGNCRGMSLRLVPGHVAGLRHPLYWIAFGIGEFRFAPAEVVGDVIRVRVHHHLLAGARAEF